MLKCVQFFLVSDQRLQGQNTSEGIWLIEITEPSHALNYKPFSNHCIL